MFRYICIYFLFLFTVLQSKSPYYKMHDELDRVERNLEDMNLQNKKAFGGCDVYKCEKKGHEPKPNRTHVPTVNGCGSYGVKFDFDVKEINECCNVHDVCYDTCQSNRTKCDKQLQQCLVDIGKKDDITEEMKKNLSKFSTAVYWITALLGCQTFEKSQAKACICTPKL